MADAASVCTTTAPKERQKIIERPALPVAPGADREGVGVSHSARGGFDFPVMLRDENQGLPREVSPQSYIDQKAGRSHCDQDLGPEAPSRLAHGVLHDVLLCYHRLSILLAGCKRERPSGWIHEFAPGRRTTNPRSPHITEPTRYVAHCAKAGQSLWRSGGVGFAGRIS